MNITRSEFERYERVKELGVVNMFDVVKVSQLSGLMRPQIIVIMKDYSRLKGIFENTTTVTSIAVTTGQERIINMPNMSYCRFQNTLQDLRDCYYAWETYADIDEDDADAGDIAGDMDILSEDEREAREALLHLCVKIVRQYGD